MNECTVYIHFKDSYKSCLRSEVLWCIWDQKYAARTDLSLSISLWLNQLSYVPPRMPLPKTYQRPSLRSYLTKQPSTVCVFTVFSSLKPLEPHSSGILYLVWNALAHDTGQLFNFMHLICWQIWYCICESNFDLLVKCMFQIQKIPKCVIKFNNLELKISSLSSDINKP